MALTFVSANGNYLTKSSPVAVGPNLSLACWANPSSFVGGPQLWTILDSGAGNETYTTGIDPTGQPLADAFHNPTENTALATAVSTNAWYHICGTFTGSTLTVYVNGTATSVAQTAAPTSLTRTFLGAFDATHDRFNGAIAEAATWTVALTQADVNQLAVARVSPRKVRPNVLVSYVRGVYGGNEPDLCSATAWSASPTAPTLSVHPPVFFP